MAAARAMLNEKHENLTEQALQDHNKYFLGRIHGHNVVLAQVMAGLAPAATASNNMTRTFPSLRVGLMVRISGGIPNLEKGIDVRLGDVVVSHPKYPWEGVIQHDGKEMLSRPPNLLLHTIRALESTEEMGDSKIQDYITEALMQKPEMKKRLGLPQDPDRFHCKVCGNDIESDVASSDGPHRKRELREKTNPEVHYGVIA